MKRRYQPWTPAEPTPTYEEAIASGAIKCGEKEWYQMSPGFRREIIRSHRRRQEVK